MLENINTKEMKPELVNKHVEAIIKATFENLKSVYSRHQESSPNKPDSNISRIIFPQYSKEYRNGETRLSEQELRFLFVEQFNKYCTNKKLNWFYSVETPTEYKYVFSEEGKKVKDPHKAEAGEKGQSAMIDFAIHNETLEKRIALVEFKALNPTNLCFTKDFAKLKAEPVENTYFVMYVKSHDAGTIDSLKLKVKTNIGKAKFYCYDLDRGDYLETEILK